MSQGPEAMKLFPDDYWRTLGSRIMKVNREIGPDWQMIPIDFELIRSKVKVTGSRNSETIFR